MPVTADGYRAALQNLVPAANPDEVMARYPLSQYPSPSQAVAAARTDSSVCGLNQSAKVYTTKVPTYAYVFADRTLQTPLGKLPTLTMGVGHGNDIQYVFQNQGIPLGLGHTVAVQHHPAKGVGFRDQLLGRVHGHRPPCCGGRSGVGHGSRGLGEQHHLRHERDRGRQEQLRAGPPVRSLAEPEGLGHAARASGAHCIFFFFFFFFF